MLTVIFFVRLVMAGLVYSALVMGPTWFVTGSLDWPRGWVAIGVLWGTQFLGGIWFLLKDPELLQERMAASGNSSADKLATALIVLLLLGWFVGNPIDVHSLQLLPAPTANVSLICGLGLYFFGLFMVLWTHRTNTFAASVVKVQEERGQYVIDTGPYAFVRHPMYAGVMPLFAGLSLLMESTAMALFVVPMIVVGFLPRILVEEATLKRELEGYDEYMSRTRWRLVPGIM